MKEHLLNVATNKQPQYIAFGVLSLVVFGLTATLSLSRVTFDQSYIGSIRVNPAGFFQSFFGNINPLTAITIISRSRNSWQKSEFLGASTPKSGVFFQLS